MVQHFLYGPHLGAKLSGLGAVELDNIREVPDHVGDQEKPVVMVTALNKHWAVDFGNSGSLDADMSPNDQYSDAMYCRTCEPCSSCSEGSQWLAPNAGVLASTLAKLETAALDAKLNQIQPKKCDSMNV